MDAARTYRREKSAKNPLVTARLLKMSNENTKLLQSEAGMILHPAYSPDLAPSDFFLFPDFKKISVDVISDLTKKSWQQLRSGSMERTLTFFSSGLMALEHCWSSASH